MLFIITYSRRWNVHPSWTFEVKRAGVIAVRRCWLLLEHG